MVAWSSLMASAGNRHGRTSGSVTILKQHNEAEPTFEIVSWDKFWSSWGLKQDLDDSFTFLSHFMLVFWDQFGSSWGLKPDLDDIFNVFKPFYVSIRARWFREPGPGKSVCRFFDPKMPPKMVQKLFKKLTKNVTTFGPILGPFWVHLGPFWGPFWG